MRSVSFVEYLEFEFSGNILERAIALGDVDNDGSCELVVANITGDLAIFKGCNVKPWRQFQGLGMTSCITIGDMCNTDRNVVFCITSEGWCHLMCFGGNGTHSDGDAISTFHQSFPTNGKVAMIADVDGDSKKELIIASTDRVVRVFKWIMDEVPIQKEMPADATKTKEKSTIPKQSSKGKLKKFLSKDSEEDKTVEPVPENNEPLQETSSKSEIFNGKFVCVKRWKLAGQVESLSAVEGRNGTSPAILVSQPGAGYVYLSCGDDSVRENLHKQTKRLIPKNSIISFTDCYSSVDNIRPQYPLPRRNEMSTVPSYAISWCNRSARRNNFIAMCTLNGTLSVIKDEKMYWSMNLHHNFFTVQKLDITGDGKEEIIFCSWDGETYIMDQYENIVNFKLGQDISAFCAGYYAMSESKLGESNSGKSNSSLPESRPCLVYVTFTNRIRLYWNVRMSRFESRNFNDTVVGKLDQLDLNPRFRDYIEAADGSLDNEKIKQLTSWCLYESRAGYNEDENVQPIQ